MIISQFLSKNRHSLLVTVRSLFFILLGVIVIVGKKAHGIDEGFPSLVVGISFFVIGFMSIFQHILKMFFTNIENHIIYKATHQIIKISAVCIWVIFLFHLFRFFL